jgi:arsenate reductase
MSETTIFHNPSCSKSRMTLAALEERGIAAKVVRYLDDPPDADQLRTIIQRLDVPASDLLRVGDDAFKASGLDAKTMDDDAIVAFLVAHPKVMQRPVVVHGERARIGRPPEHVLSLFDTGSS